MTPGRVALAAVATSIGVLFGFAPAQERKEARTPVAAPVAAPRAFQVEKHTDLAYVSGPDADSERHKLDVYVPKGRKGYPVLLFVHGGSWKSGNKGLYVALGEAFARLGIGTVITNYRLSPKVKHPAHVEDIAKAFAWTHHNIAKYGGDAGRLFLFGHSAGGHLVSLLATDPQYLKAEKLSSANVCGVVSVSGVYKIYHNVEWFHPMFGENEKVCLNASPLEHASENRAPFLIAYADKDFNHLDRMALDMNAALERCKCRCRLLKLQDRNHYTIITNAIELDDPLNKAIREFVLSK